MSEWNSFSRRYVPCCSSYLLIGCLTWGKLAFYWWKLLPAAQDANGSHLGQLVTDPVNPLAFILGFGLVRPIIIFTLVTQWINPKQIQKKYHALLMAIANYSLLISSNQRKSRTNPSLLSLLLNHDECIGSSPGGSPQRAQSRWASCCCRRRWRCQPHTGFPLTCLVHAVVCQWVTAVSAIDFHTPP
jgi:hypothetical protein